MNVMKTDLKYWFLMIYCHLLLAHGDGIWWKKLHGWFFVPTFALGFRVIAVLDGLFV